VMDLSSLRYSRSVKKARLSVTGASGELLGRIPMSATTPLREAAFEAMNAALDQGRVARDGELLRVAFYNPYSGEVAYNGVPATEVYSCGEPIELGSDGSVFELDGDEMVRGDVVLSLVAPSMARTSRALLSHSLV
jgi:hypothetical protein